MSPSGIELSAMKIDIKGTAMVWIKGGTVDINPGGGSVSGKSATDISNVEAAADAEEFKGYGSNETLEKILSEKNEESVFNKDVEAVQLADANFSFENLEDAFRTTLWNDTGLTPEEVPEVLGESIKESIKEGAQSVVDNGPTVLGAAALSVPHPMVKAGLSASSVVAGVAQDVENENVNNIAGSGTGEFTQKVLEKIPATKHIAEQVGFGVSESISRNIGSDDEQ
ncbi:MAG: hypothetical protein L3J00_04480 [Thiomicrorhabdus sp.]|nr:hypothetical protein [Thiomicrorhabdus sp.]